MIQPRMALHLWPSPRALRDGRAAGPDLVGAGGGREGSDVWTPVESIGLLKPERGVHPDRVGQIGARIRRDMED